MKTTKIIGIAMLGLIGCLALETLAADPTISQVVVRQRWPWSRLVDIDYVIANATPEVDIQVSAFNGDQPLVLDNGLSGDLHGVSGQGTRRIIWDPTQSQYTNEEVLSQFRVTLTPTLAPLYMIVDLTKDAGTVGQIEYIYPGDARLETYGRFTNVWFGVTNGVAGDTDVYRTTKLVLRRLSAGTSMAITLTKPFYISVFEITQRQWELISGAPYTCYYTNVLYAATRPVDSVRYIDIRDQGWPESGHAVVSGFIRKLRDKTGVETFDLPTGGQWEYACRAGTTTSFNDGSQKTSDYYDTALTALARYAYDGGLVADPTADPLSWLPATNTNHSAAEKDNKAPRNCSAEFGNVKVGSFIPNAWGLYDMHGNQWEWCLDRSKTLTGNWVPSGIDPVGPKAAESSDAGSRSKRGGSWSSRAAQCVSSYWSSDAATTTFISGSYPGQHGFRVVSFLP